MTDINLLPWREHLHQKAKKQWLMGLSVVLGLSLFILVLTCVILNAKIHRTLAINEKLNVPLKSLSSQLQRIKMIEYKKMEVTVKAAVFQTLEKERWNTMTVLSDLLSRMPLRMYLTALGKQNSQWKLEGAAESFLQVSNFVHKLAEISQITDPKLLQVGANDIKKDDGQHHFALTFETRVNRAAP